MNSAMVSRSFFVHTEAVRGFDGADGPSPLGLFPTSGLPSGDKVLVGDDAGFGELMRHFKPAAELFDARNDLMTLAVAFFVRTQDRTPRSSSAFASALEFLTICAIENLPNSIISAAETASAATRLT